MTPSFMGLIAVMLPGVRPSISLASMPTASMRPVTLFMATIDGSLTTMPRPRAKTQVLAVPRSMARSWEKRARKDANTRGQQARLVPPTDRIQATEMPGLSTNPRSRSTVCDYRFCLLLHNRLVGSQSDQRIHAVRPRRGNETGGYGQERLEKRGLREGRRGTTSFFWRSR